MKFNIISRGKVLRRTLAATLFFLSGSAFAMPQPSMNDFMPCFSQAAERYGVNVYLLKAIALHESGMNPTANNTENFDDSEDIGIMQVNSWWLKNELHKYGINRDRLWNPCLNIHTGAWILAQEIQRHGHGWEAVGYYNARTDWKRKRYIGQIQKSLQRVYAQYGITNVNPLIPSLPLDAKAQARSATMPNPWGANRTWAATRKRAPTKKVDPPNSQRRIIVVTAAQSQING